MESFNSIESLKKYGETHSVNDVLCTCFKVSKCTKLMSLLCNDLSPLLEAWAYDNGIDEIDILDAIELNAESVNRLSVEKYPDCDGWAECELKLQPDVNLRFSWDLG